VVFDLSWVANLHVPHPFLDFGRLRRLVFLGLLSKDSEDPGDTWRGPWNRAKTVLEDMGCFGKTRVSLFRLATQQLNGLDFNLDIY
jgi:hypothetical protein